MTELAQPEDKKKRKGVAGFFADIRTGYAERKKTRRSTIKNIARRRSGILLSRFCWCCWCKIWLPLLMSRSLVTASSRPW